MTIDFTEKKLLGLFRKMDGDQKMIVKNTQMASNSDSIAPSLSAREKEKINRPNLADSQANNLTQKRGRLDHIKENKK